MNINDIREHYQEHFGQEYGYNDFAMDMAEDATREAHQSILAMEEQRDLWEQDNTIRFPKFVENNDSPLPAVAIGIPLCSTTVIVGVIAVTALAGLGIWLLHKRFNQSEH